MHFYKKSRDIKLSLHFLLQALHVDCNSPTAETKVPTAKIGVAFQFIFPHFSQMDTLQMDFPDF